MRRSQNVQPSINQHVPNPDNFYLRHVVTHNQSIYYFIQNDNKVDIVTPVNFNFDFFVCHNFFTKSNQLKRDATVQGPLNNRRRKLILDI
jgi:hypothetical protein